MKPTADRSLPKSAAELNAEHIEAIIVAESPRCGPRVIARKIVEAFPELRPHQYTMERDGSSRAVGGGVPWRQGSP
jgi:hypothetical protein